MVLGRKDPTTDMEYRPQETDVHRYSALAVDFNTKGVVRVLNKPEMVILGYNLIALSGGNCPNFYESATKVSNLPSVQITAPTGYRLVYRVKEKRATRSKNALGQISGCSSWTQVTSTGDLFLEPGESVTFRTQLAGSDKMYSKEISLMEAEPTTKKCPDGSTVDISSDCPPYNPPVQNQTCPDGTVIPVSETCPSTKTGEHSSTATDWTGGLGGSFTGSSGGQPTGISPIVIVGIVSAIAIIGTVGAYVALKE